MRTKGPFTIGDAIVYPLHGRGWVRDIVTRSFGDDQQACYELVFDTTPVSVWLPMEHATLRGLRRPLSVRQAQRALRTLQQASERQPHRKQALHHYAWCKERLRQGDALGLWEVRRFLHDLKPIESLNTPEWRYLQSYVMTQTEQELIHALGCEPAVAAQLIETALLAAGPQRLSVPAPVSPDRC